MGACTSKSEILKNAGEDFPVEKEVVVVQDADVVEDSQAKQQSVNNLLNQNDEEKVSVEKPLPEQEYVKHQEIEPPVVAGEAELVLENESSEVNNVEAEEEVTKTENVEAKEEAEIIKIETSEESEEADEKNNNTEVESEAAGANKTEKNKEDAKPLFKLWF